MWSETLTPLASKSFRSFSNTSSSPGFSVDCRDLGDVFAHEGPHDGIGTRNSGAGAGGTLVNHTLSLSRKLGNITFMRNYSPRRQSRVALTIGWAVIALYLGAWGVLTVLSWTANECPSGDNCVAQEETTPRPI
jgi:hypothetical protein